MHKLLRNGQKEAALKVRKQLQRLPSIDPHDPDYRRLKYVRYADDFGIVFTGPKQEAEEIKQQLVAVLREDLGMSRCEEKMISTHTRRDGAHIIENLLTMM